MVIGERIKQGRRMAGLSQRALGALAGVSAQAISKYERGFDVPGSKVLIQLSKALNLSVEFFLRPPSLTKIEPKFRKRQALPAKEEDRTLAIVLDWLERYAEIDQILYPEEQSLRFVYPPGFPRNVSTLDDVEEAAEDLRRSWKLGTGPIESLISLLEGQGIKVGLIDSDAKFDACTFQAEDDSTVTAIVTRSRTSGDRQRFSLAHELGHLMLRPAGIDEEKAANRFAGAFLVPQAAARFELRGRRENISVYELHILKHKYGLSMQAWINRAKDLEIISESRARSLFQYFSAQGWRKDEPGDRIPQEQPRRFEMLVIGSLTDGIISETRASELLGKPVRDFLTEADPHGAWLAEVCH